ncbi:MAG: ribonuclease P protein component [Muribaculaceae bacterium]|nr:ribonuclease P protein component [Muribaculaceae bacterium]
MNNGQSDINPVENRPELPAQRRFTLRKGEKLRHRSLVESLFREGHTLYEFPLRLTWRSLTPEELEESFRDHVPDRIDSLQMLITVPKKKRRHAVDRVLMRRRIREAYRLNRLALKEEMDSNPDVRTLGMAIIYLHDKNLPYSTIENKMKLLLNRLAAKLRGKSK